LEIDRTIPLVLLDVVADVEGYLPVDHGIVVALLEGDGGERAPGDIGMYDRELEVVLADDLQSPGIHYAFGKEEGGHVPRAEGGELPQNIIKA